MRVVTISKRTNCQTVGAFRCVVDGEAWFTATHDSTPTKRQ